MKKYLNHIFLAFLLLSLFCFQPNKALAVDEVNFSIYYQTIEDTVQINEDLKEDASLWDKVKHGAKSLVNWGKKTWEQNITRNYTLGEGESLWYSKEDKNLAYKVKRTKVSTEEELIKAMGKNSEDELTYGQKCLLASFRAAKSQAMLDRADASYRSKINLILTDTGDYPTTRDDTDPNVRRDFWPCSSGPTIFMSDGIYKYQENNNPSGIDNAYSTTFHEYSHSMDRTLMEFKNPYGLDGTHYTNEVTKQRSAFLEGWAEYNEMIENEAQAQKYINETKKLSVESTTVSGDYDDLDPADATAEQLLCAESYNCYLLYRLATTLDNGENKITKAFVSTRWNWFRDMNTLIKKLVKQNPDDTETICRIVDEVFLGKLSDEQFYKMVGKNKATKAYVENRGKAEATTEGETEGTTVTTTEEDETTETVSSKKTVTKSKTTSPY